MERWIEHRRQILLAMVLASLHFPDVRKRKSRPVKSELPARIRSDTGGRLLMHHAVNGAGIVRIAADFQLS